jgi:hypothetical protein
LYLLLAVRMFYADFRGLSLEQVHGFEMRNLVEFSASKYFKFE